MQSLKEGQVAQITDRQGDSPDQGHQERLGRREWDESHFKGDAVGTGKGAVIVRA